MVSIAVSIRYKKIKSTFYSTEQDGKAKKLFKYFGENRKYQAIKYE